MNDIKAWLYVILLGLCKWPAKIVAPVVVPFLSNQQRWVNPVFGVRDATNLSWWNIGVRNGCHNMTVREMPIFHTWGGINEALPGFQWRYRRSECGKYVSFRMAWGKPRIKKGKREFYVGWVMNNTAYMRLTFFQLRLF